MASQSLLRLLPQALDDLLPFWPHLSTPQTLLFYLVPKIHHLVSGGLDAPPLVRSLAILALSQQTEVFYALGVSSSPVALTPDLNKLIHIRAPGSRFALGGHLLRSSPDTLNVRPPSKFRAPLSAITSCLGWLSLLIGLWPRVFRKDCGPLSGSPVCQITATVLALGHRFSSGSLCSRHRAHRHLECEHVAWPRSHPDFSALYLSPSCCGRFRSTASYPLSHQVLSQNTIISPRARHGPHTHSLAEPQPVNPLASGGYEGALPSVHGVDNHGCSGLRLMAVVRIVGVPLLETLGALSPTSAQSRLSRLLDISSSQLSGPCLLLCSWIRRPPEPLVSCRIRSDDLRLTCGLRLGLCLPSPSYPFGHLSTPASGFSTPTSSQVAAKSSQARFDAPLAPKLFTWVPCHVSSLSRPNVQPSSLFMPSAYRLAPEA